MAANKRLIYFLGFLVVVLPVIVGILVWQLLPDCDADDKKGGNKDEIKGTPQTTAQPRNKGTTEKGTPQTTALPLNKGTTEEPFEDGPWKNLRLPKTVVPIHYEVTLFPDFYEDHETFYGNITTELYVQTTTNIVMVHIKYLNISQTNISTDIGRTDSIPIKRTFEYGPHEFWVVETETPLKFNTTVYLHMTFSGSLTRSIVGFYKSSYINSDTNKSSSIATTKFEPVAARRAFPCFDEPNIKAEYTVHLVHRPTFKALSNMPANETEVWAGDQKMSITSFQRSVKMSTYLACFIVCDFEFLENTSASGITVRLYAPPDRVNQTKFALDVAITAVDLYTKMFNVSYPLPKLDLISIPDFVSGAMENWGLITFRETNILYDPEQSSSANKQRVATVVAHEVSHQWFGNLVTMDWWQDLWLNEGFASFMEYIGAAEHQPDWQILDYFLIGDLQPVMVTDAGVASHPIIVQVEDPAQINAVFDSISYSKGCSIIRMLEHWMGSDAFFHGVSRYLRHFQYQNAHTDDLWTFLGNISTDLSVKTVMDTWTKQMGLPFINVTVNGSKVTLTQERFLADSSIHYDPSESEYGYMWYIKLDYMRSDGQTGSRWMMKEQSRTFDVGADIEKNSWIKFNLNETGFYRVNYPEFLWKRLSTELAADNNMLSITDRANLLDDAFNLARAGHLSYDIALDMTSYLDKEREYLPWKSTANALSYLSTMLEFTGDFSYLQEYKVMKVLPTYKEVGWVDTGSHVRRLMRSTIISLTCGNGHPGCLKVARQRFSDWLSNGTIIPPNLRSVIYTYGMRSVQTPIEWMKVWEKYKAESVPQERSKLMSALAQTPSISLLMRYIDFAKDESNVRSQDYFTVLTYIARNPVGRGLVWNWVRDNWQYLVNRFTLYSRYFGRLIPSVVSDFNTQYQLEEVETFFKKYPEAGAGANGRKQALESIRRNINWMKQNKHVVVKWLKGKI
ncbi:glutamyl aminopeptidase-like [Mercenaria mercenaria]|uniref:glutamyl aminopeptidase-like n=1 Tax=Mercenaria mercenaria TaxID=6596 RepID=UPI00234F486D|nr:glutamyl aminopeptidase-like [Mercenaria mercenaria]